MKTLQEEVFGVPAREDEEEWFVALPEGFSQQRRVHLIADLGVPAAERPRPLQRRLTGGVALLTSSHLARGASVFAEERFFSAFRLAAEALDGTELLLTAPDPAVTPGDLAHRGIRGLLLDTALFEAFLRAVYRISALARVSVLLPFVGEPAEAEGARRCAENAMRALLLRREPFDETVETGILVETPAAALGGRQLMEDWDFSIVNTTALAGFGLAHPEGTPLTKAGRKVLLRLVEESVETAHVCGRFAGVGGFLAKEKEALPALLGSGTNALLLPPELLAATAARIRKLPD